MPGARGEGAGDGGQAALLTGRRAQWYLLLLHAGLVQAVTSVVRPTTSYRALELGVPPQWLGALSAGFALLPLLAALGVGRVTDRRGERPVLVAGAVTLLASTLVFAAFGTSLALLVAGSAVLGLGHLLLMVSEQSMVAGVARERGRDVAFGHYTFVVSAGQAVGPSALAAFGGSSVQPDTEVLFVSAIVMAGVVFAVALCLRSVGRGVRTDLPVGRAWGLVHVPGLPAAVVASLVVVSAIDLLAVYLPALGTERGIAAGTIGLLLALRALTSMVSRFLLPAGVARLGRVALLVSGSVAAGAALVVLALPVPLAVMAVAVGVTGLGLGVGQPLTLSWVTLLAPAHRRATALSLRLTGNRLGQTVVPATVGLLASRLGAGGVLAATGLLLGGATALAARRVAQAGAPDRGEPPPTEPTDSP